MKPRWNPTRTPQVAVLILVTAACGSGDRSSVSAPVQTGRSERPAILSLYDIRAEVDLPDRATAGQPFPVRVATLGGHCRQKSRADVSANGLRVDIAPFDSVYTPGPDEICSAYLEYQVHDLELTLTRAGEATVIVRGRRVPGDEPFSITKRLTVLQR